MMTSNKEESACQQDLNDDELETSVRRGRLYIPHGNGTESVYKPHQQHIAVKNTECGLDWSSRLRTLPSPRPTSGEPADTLFYPPMKSLRHYGDRWVARESTHEYAFYPPKSGYLVTSDGAAGKVTIFDDGEHRGSVRCDEEVTDQMRFGKRRFTVTPHVRNNIAEAAPGDKPYQAVEYSANFHKTACMLRPFVEKRAGSKPNRNQLILGRATEQARPCKSYATKECERRRREEVAQVESLQSWRPASPLVAPAIT